jgi:hypothetical protein
MGRRKYCRGTTRNLNEQPLKGLVVAAAQDGAVGGASSNPTYVLCGYSRTVLFGV